MKTKTKRPKSEIIRSNAALLLKQIGNYKTDLPVGELRNALTALEMEAEQFLTKVNEALPIIDDSE